MLVVTIQHFYNDKSIVVTVNSRPGPGKDDVVATADRAARVALNAFEDKVMAGEYTGQTHA